MRGEFDQWVAQSGAPRIKVSRAEARPEGEGYVLTALLEQVQPGGPYRLRIPVAVTMGGLARADQRVVVMEAKRVELKIRVPARPLRVDIDPEFDMFRRLDREEIPPALTQAFGAKEMLVVLPSAASDGLLQAYREFAQSLSHSGPDVVEVKFDREVEEIPWDRAVTILGWGNLFQREIASVLSGYDVTIDQRGVHIGQTEIPRENHSVVLTARHPENKDLSLTWVASDLPEALPGLGRKLPHYHKYSYLGFEGKEPANMAKGRWPVIDSPMTVFLPLRDGTIPKVEMGELASREPLAILPPVFSRKRMMETIRFLSSDTLRGRGVGTEGLDRAAEFIAERFQEAGLKPAGDGEGGYFQIWEGRGGEPERKVRMRNVIGVIPGEMPDREGPMTATLRPAGEAEIIQKREQQVSLGTIPDFAFSGDGYRLSGVVRGSPAEACGLKQGDVIVRIGSSAVRDVRDLSDILKSLNPRDRITITFLREGEEMIVVAEVVEK